MKIPMIHLSNYAKNSIRVALLSMSFGAWSAAGPAPTVSCVASVPVIDNTYTVISPLDTGSVGELRWAIQQSNANPPAAGHLNQIDFNLGSGPFIIKPLTALDAITQPVFINGYSQSPASCNTDLLASNAVLLIEINGSNYTVGTGAFSDPDSNGLHLAGSATGSIISGLIINEWIGAGIFIDGTVPGSNVDNCTIVGNFIGTNSTATAVSANQLGVLINGANGTIIGDATPAGRNVFAGSFCTINAGACISAYFGNGTSIKGNLVGLDKTGTSALGNSQVGIQVASTFQQPAGQADSVVIGGTTAAERNVVSGHFASGIALGGQTTNSVVQGNYVGTDVTGKIVIGNGNRGIALWGIQLSGSQINSSGNIIGGTVPGAGNLVVGSGVMGINVGDGFLLFANNNFVQGNLVGTNVDGTAVLGNDGFGITILDASNTVGGSPEAANIVAGSGKAGIAMYGPQTTNVVVSYNFVGTDKTGTVDLANSGPGVQIGIVGGLGGASNNHIGA